MKLKTKILGYFREIWKIRPLENLLVSLTTDKYFGTAITRFPPNNFQYRKGTIRKACRHGVNYVLDISDLVDWYIYYGFRDQGREKLLSLIHEGDFIIDVGANVGDVCMHAARITGEKGRIIAFEPDPVNFIRLNRNLALNNFQNIEVFNLGLGNKSGSFRIQSIDKGNFGMNRITSSDQPDRNSREIKVITLDEFIADQKPPKIDLIKIDVEGFEMNVIKGAEQTIRQYGPAFFIKLGDKNLRAQGSYAAEIVGLLRSHGYRLNHSVTDENLDETYNFTNCHFNIVARKN